MKRKTQKKKAGISLIVLVITIAVMIILAAAIILSLNSSGIIGKANEAKSDTDKSVLLEVANVEALNWELEQRLNNTDDDVKTYVVNKLKEQGFTDEQISELEITESGEISIKQYTTYKDANDDTAPIPDGFTVSTVSTEQTIDDGLVIRDDDGNEFVWVPVLKISDFVKGSWTYGIAEDDEYTLMEQYDLSIAEEAAEYSKLRESVEKRGGFYIARYEAGLPTGVTIDKANYGQLAGSLTKPVSKKDATVWNAIPWDSTWTGEETINLYGSWNNPGCAKVARAAYSSSESVVSHLIYGVEWDSALRFISKTDEEFPENSTNKDNW